MSTEFFKTLKEAEGFASQYNPKCTPTVVYGLDKPGTVKQFRAEQNDAISWGRRESYSARAVVVLYR